MTERRGHALVVGLLVAQVLLAAAGAWSWARSTLAQGQVGSGAPAMAPVVPRPVNIESALPFAAARAGEWAANARLVLVSAQLDWPLDVPPGPTRGLPGGGWLTYVFVRERDGEAESLGLLIERYSGAIVQERVVAWGGPAPSDRLDVGSLPVDSAAALMAAEGAGGTEFRRDCPQARHQTRISLGISGAVTEPTPAATPTTVTGAVWLLGYRDVRDEGRAPLLISVDAVTGVVAVEDRQMAAVAGCPG